MKTLTKSQSENFLSGKPTELLTRTNSYGQTCVYFEHPAFGEDAPIYVAIGNNIANTGYRDLSDFYIGSDYEPQLQFNGHEYIIDCKFEVEKLRSIK